MLEFLLISVKQIYLDMNQQELDYFVPPPINVLNKSYYQQLKSISNPLSHATRHYSSFQQDLPLDQSYLEGEGMMLTDKVKRQLKDLNIAIYASMMKYLEALSGQGSLEQLKSTEEPPIKTKMIKFISICQQIKKHQTRQGICKIMTKQMSLIRDRTQEIIRVLLQVKNSLQIPTIEDNRFDNTGQ